jgi:uridylate kinase
MADNKKIIISLGGSLMVPDEIDVSFIKKFKDLIESYVNKQYRFYIIVGGGKICRRYQSAANELARLSPEETDWIGIHVTRLNAHFMRVIFKELAYPDIITDPELAEDIKHPVVIGAGWKPGWSTDFDAIILAKTVGAERVINLTNTDYVYDSDPKHNPDAKKITDISWADFRNIIPKEWQPGLNSPFDPIASKEAEANGIEVAIMNGQNIENLSKYLDDLKFEGTIIRS